MRRRTRRNGRNERGAAAVEFALVVPVLLTLVIGIINFGFVFAQQISLNNAARQAARYAVVDGRTCSDIKNEGRSAAETVGMSVSAGTVPTPVVTNCGADSARPCAGTAPNTNITVTMTRAGSANVWVVTAPPFNLIAVPTVQGRGVMRCEFS
jgi:Flp pilus assembly protein TadG